MSSVMLGTACWPTIGGVRMLSWYKWDADKFVVNRICDVPPNVGNCRYRFCISQMLANYSAVYCSAIRDV